MTSIQFEKCEQCNAWKDVLRGQRCRCDAEFPEHMKDHPYIKERESRAVNEMVLKMLDHFDR